MPKLKRSPLARLRIAVKLEIVLAAKKQSVPKKDVEKFLTAEYAALANNQRKYISKLLLVDWPKYGSKELLEKSLAEITPWLKTCPPEPVTTLGLSYPYLRQFEHKYGGKLWSAVMFAQRRYELEVSWKYSKLDLYDPEDEDDDMMYFIDRQLEKPD